MKLIRAPSSVPPGKKRCAWFARLLRKGKKLLSYRIRFVRAGEEQREVIERIEELTHRLAAVRNGTEFRWIVEHLMELMAALEKSPYFNTLPGIMPKDLRAFSDLREALYRARKFSAINDPSDYIEELRAEAERRSAHVRPKTHKPLFPQTSAQHLAPWQPGIFRRYRSVFRFLFFLGLLYLAWHFLLPYVISILSPLSQ